MSSSELLRALTETLGLGVIVLDSDLRVEYWNEFVTTRTGNSPDRGQGRLLSEVFPEAGMASLERMMHELASTKAQRVYNQWLESPPLVQLSSTDAGEPGSLQTSLLFPFSTGDGRSHVALLLHDTSAVTRCCEQLEVALSALGRKQAEQDQLLRKLEAANSQLLQSEKLAAIGQLAAGVAHEINNPIGYVFSNLRSLGGYVSSMLRIIDAIDEATHTDELRQLKANLEYGYIRQDVEALIAESEDGIDRVKRIISALKDFSHIDEEEFRAADLHRGLDTTLNVVNNELKYKAEVVKEYGELPNVECIPSQINQVVMNLLVNAAHAIEQFGRISLRTACDDRWAWIEVEDTGKGIDPKLINRIYEPFFTTKPVGKGTGLGLALSYSIVQKHHGRIEVQSELGKGTRFRVWLPLRQPDGMSGQE